MTTQLKSLRVAVASGKGGTGKTTLATNLARTETGQQVTEQEGSTDRTSCRVLRRILGS